MKRSIYAITFMLVATCFANQDKSAVTESEFFTLIVLPDTQGYADTRHQETQKHWPEIGDQRSCFYAQTDWILKNHQKLNIAMVAHVGDITQTDHDDEWNIADTAFKSIDDHVPYILCSGNHDMGYSQEHRTTSHSRESRFGQYFPPSRFMENPVYHSHFGPMKNNHFKEGGKIENYYLYFEASGMKFLVLTLEFKPTDETLAWANKIVNRHPDHRTIVITHAYLKGRSGQRTTSDNYHVKGNSGKNTWEKFIWNHRNIFLVLSGHAKEDFLTSKGKFGNTVHQVQADYWYWDSPEIKAGSGYLRIMTFRPNTNSIEVQTYSPVTGQYLTRPSSHFSFQYSMSE